MQSDYSSSDLTDLSDEEEVPLSHKFKKSKKGVAKKGEYRLKRSLKPARTTFYSTKSLYDQIHNGDVDLDPDYQRDVVWSEAKQTALIDSVFRNFYIPPVIFAVTTDEDGIEHRTCIDGKQRLTSIQKFMDGLIPHKDMETGEQLWYCDNGTSKGQRSKVLLPKRYITHFENKQIVCVEYSDLPPEYEREVFRRVQMGVALTPAERMQAISGPWPSMVREVMEQYVDGVGLLSTTLEWDTSRGRDFQLVAQAIFCIEKLPDYAQGSSNQLEKWLKREDAPTPSFISHVKGIFQTLLSMSKDKDLKKHLTKPTRISPVEFVMSLVLIAKHKKILSNQQLASAIGAMRDDTRTEYADVRNNSKIQKFLFHFLQKQVKASAFSDDTGGGYHKVPKKKRQRSQGSDDDDDEYFDFPAPKRVSATKGQRIGSVASPSSKAPPTPQETSAKNYSSGPSPAMHNLPLKPPMPSQSPVVPPPSPLTHPLPARPSNSLARLMALREQKQESRSPSLHSSQAPTPVHSASAAPPTGPRNTAQQSASSLEGALLRGRPTAMQSPNMPGNQLGMPNYNSSLPGQAEAGSQSHTNGSKLFKRDSPDSTSSGSRRLFGSQNSSQPFSFGQPRGPLAQR